MSHRDACASPGNREHLCNEKSTLSLSPLQDESELNLEAHVDP